MHLSDFSIEKNILTIDRLCSRLFKIFCLANISRFIEPNSIHIEYIYDGTVWNCTVKVTRNRLAGDGEELRSMERVKGSSF